MKFLLDENISRRVTKYLAESTHVGDLGLGSGTDDAVWNYARSNGLAIVTKDSDFNERATTFGAPPKIVWLRRGNCSTDELRDLLVQETERILSFLQEKDAAVLMLF